MRCIKCGEDNPAQSAFCRACGTPSAMAAYAAPGAALGVPLGIEAAAGMAGYAGFWYRALAFLIDTILSTVLGFVLVLPLGFAYGVAMASNGMGEEGLIYAEAFGNLFGLLVSWLYFTICESSGWQATPGKKMLGLRVTDLDGRRIGFGRANGRYWGKILSALILMIGYLMAAFTARKQALHDMLASTLVVRNA